MCPSCGIGLPNGSGICPNCGASITIEKSGNEQSHLYNVTNEFGNHLGNTASGSIKLFIVLGIVSLLFPITLLNPISVNHFLIKQRRFQSISETGRLLAYKLSFLYTAWFSVFLLMIVKTSEMDTLNNYLYWLFPSYGIIMLLIALLLVWNTIKEHFFKNQMTVGVLHILGTISLMIFATIPIPVLLIFKAFMVNA